MEFKEGIGPHAQDLMRTATLSQMPFAEAAFAWLESRRFHLAPMTTVGYSYYIKEMHRFFGDVHIQDITGDMVRLYQAHRRKNAGADLINKELGVLTQIRVRMGIPLHDYQRLPKAKDWEPVGRALHSEEENRVVDACKEYLDHPSWDMAALATLLSLSSGMGPGEILSLKLKHCSLDPAWVLVPRSGAKRIKRERPVVLGEFGAIILRKALERASRKCGCMAADDQLFPFRNKNHTFDPKKPAKGYRGGMKAILLRAGVTMRRYDGRHTAFSKAAADSTISDRDLILHFGWNDMRMFRVYRHVNNTQLKHVASAIEKKPQSVNFIDNLLKTG